jgi:dolichyl-phosphate beta-glucosyltransferase
MPYNDQLISVVVPAYNAGGCLRDSCGKIAEYLRNESLRYEIIIVDDGSSDDTAGILNELSSLDSNIRFLTNSKNMGKGYSVRKGVLASRGDYVFFTDADLSTPLCEMRKLFSCLWEGYDIVIASRALPDSNVIIHQPLYREHSGKLFNLIMRSVLFLDVKDTQCGFKCFRREAALSVFGKQTLTGFCFDAEVLYIAKKKGYKIKEVPVAWINSEDSSVNLFGDGLRMFVDLVRIRINDWRGVYS